MRISQYARDADDVGGHPHVWLREDVRGRLDKELQLMVLCNCEVEGAAWNDDGWAA